MFLNLTATFETNDHYQILYILCEHLFQEYQDLLVLFIIFRSLWFLLLCQFLLERSWINLSLGLPIFLKTPLISSFLWF